MAEFARQTVAHLESHGASTVKWQADADALTALLATADDAERVIDNLASCCRSLIYSVRRFDPGCRVAENALGYLKRRGLQGSPLRDDAAIDAARRSEG